MIFCTAKEWPIARIGDIVDLFDHQRVPLNSRERQRRPGPYSYYGAQGVIDHIDNYLFDGSYILVAEDGENLNSRKLPIALKASGKFWVNNHAHVIRGKKGLLDDRYLLAVLNSLDIGSYVTGAAQPKLSQANLRRIEVPLPPLGLQCSIAGILTTYDDLIENCQRRIEILESMARAIYREWFVHFRFPGRELDRLPSECPDGWELRLVKDIAEVTYGFPFQSKRFSTEVAGESVVRIRDIPNGVSSTFTDEPFEPRYRIQDGNILVGMDGDFHMCIWSGGPAAQNQRVARFQSKGEIGKYHLFLALEGPIQELNRAITGTTVAHLGDMHIRNIQLLWPPDPLRAMARDLLDPIADEIVILKKEIRNLRKTRDLLLPRLMSGQIDVEALAP